MKRFWAILLLGVFAAWGSGGLDAAHRLQHERAWEAYTRLMIARTGQAPRGMPLAPVTDECTLCVALHAPIALTGFVIVVPSLLFRRCLVPECPRQFVPVLELVRLDCRGPPAI